MPGTPARESPCEKTWPRRPTAARYRRSKCEAVVLEMIAFPHSLSSHPAATTGPVFRQNISLINELRRIEFLKHQEGISVLWVELKGLLIVGDGLRLVAVVQVSLSQAVVGVA
jgi:hypothetical protein